MLASYASNPAVLGLGPLFQEKERQKIRLSGLCGSLRQFILAALVQQTERGALLIVNDREDALYAANDLESLLPTHQVLVFPGTGRRPYRLDDIDNANVLQRAEVLTTLQRAEPGTCVVVTYPDALGERVVNQSALVKHTLVVKTGEEVGQDFVVEILEDYGFNQVPFVYEPGQYAVRGGLVDVFSFSHDYPYRLEFLGDELESIRTFDPVDQLSVAELKQAALIPDIQRQLIEEARVSLLEFLSPSTLVFTEQLGVSLGELDKFYERAEVYFRRKREAEPDTFARNPEELLVSSLDLLEHLRRFHLLEVGAVTHFRKFDATLEWKSQPQPVFKREFKLLANHLAENSRNGYRNFLFVENSKQGRRLREVLQHIAPEVPYEVVETALAFGFQDQHLKLACYTDHQIFDRYHRYRTKAHRGRSKALTLKELTDLKPGDFVTHVNHGVGQFGGLETLETGEHSTEAVRLVFRDGDVVYVNVNALYKISKYTGREGTAPKLSKLGSGEWERRKQKVKKRVKELAFDLVELYAERKAKSGFACGPDTPLQTELEASFLYEDTPDQAAATEAVKADMEAGYPMDRLVCGDVGFGKTEVAVRAAFKAASYGKQVAVLVPTTILALQHFQTFQERYEGFPLRVDYLNRFRSAAEQKAVLKDLADGKIEVLIGTHRLLSKDVVFQDLGLIIIDEEHKFGVAAKEKLRRKRVEVDTLTLTATPIPRTLQFSLLGIRDMSIIATPPPNRRPVETMLHTFDAELIRDAVAYELKRGGQVFFIHNRIKDLDEHAALIKRLVPDARVAIGHGQMPADKLEETLMGFIDRRYDVLVCTTIVESGMDIPNANTILINRAHTYGLSDLHQMRGRVGRSNRKAFCYLFAPGIHTLPADSRKRLEAIVEFSDVGSGIQIAMRDLDIRGAGDILGGEQSGFINDIGFDLYNKVLEEAIAELKAEFFTDSFDDIDPGAGTDTQVDVEEDARLPAQYVPDTAERLALYRRISAAKAESELAELGRELIDRFGLLPKEVLTLFDTIRLREVGRQLGFHRLVLKSATLRAYLPTEQTDPYYQSERFNRVLAYVQRHPQGMQLRQVRGKLVLQIDSLPDTKTALLKLRDALAYVREGAADNNAA